MLAACTGGIHRAALISAIEQKFREDGRIARDESRAHAGHVGALGQAAEHDEPRIARAAELMRGLQARRAAAAFVEVDLRIALVGRDHEAVAVRQLEQLLPLVERHHVAGRVGGRAHVDELHALPQVASGSCSKSNA